MSFSPLDWDILISSFKNIKLSLRDAFKKKNYVDRETVPIPSYPPTIEAVSEYLDREYW